MVREPRKPSGGVVQPRRAAHSLRSRALVRVVRGCRRRSAKVKSYSRPDANRRVVQGEWSACPHHQVLRGTRHPARAGANRRRLSRLRRPRGQSASIFELKFTDLRKRLDEGHEVTDRLRQLTELLGELDRLIESSRSIGPEQCKPGDICSIIPTVARRDRSNTQGR